MLRKFIELSSDCFWAFVTLVSTWDLPNLQLPSVSMMGREEIQPSLQTHTVKNFRASYIFDNIPPQVSFKLSLKDTGSNKYSKYDKTTVKCVRRMLVSYRCCRLWYLELLLTGFKARGNMLGRLMIGILLKKPF